MSWTTPSADSSNHITSTPTPLSSDYRNRNGLADGPTNSDPDISSPAPPYHIAMSWPDSSNHNPPTTTLSVTVPHPTMSWADSSGHNAPSTTSPGSEDHKDDDDLTDAEGVWSADIEQSFQEALAIYPPCGRRKIILSDEGKMYGRNELIARYIKLRTGKTRTRKQVSSHIQVLARRKSKEIHAQLKAHISPDQTAKDKALHVMAGMSSAQIVSAGVPHNKGVPGIPGEALSPQRSGYPLAPPFWQPGLSGDMKPSFPPGEFPVNQKLPHPPEPYPHPPWQGRSIAGPKLRMVEFSAFLVQQRESELYHKHVFVHIGPPAGLSDPVLEAVDIRQIYDKFPEKKGGFKEIYDKGPQSAFYLVKFWADLNTNVQDEAGAFYGVTSQYECSENVIIECCTKVCSFGKNVVEKVEKEYSRLENGRYVYHITQSPMCEYMINFIHKLKQLPEKYMMNSVLENFTILQVVTNFETGEVLLCVAYVFEVSSSEHGAQHHIYRLVKD